MITLVSPITLTDPDDEKKLNKPAVGQVMPRRLSRPERPEAQLTDAAASELLNSGRLTNRDLRILQAAWMFGVITTGQVQRLIFYTLKNLRDARRVANRRLRFLYEEYCLDRVLLSINQEMVYTLSQQGARLMQMQQKKNSRREIKWSPRSVGEKLLLLDHYLEVTEFAVRLTEAARPSSGSLQWLGENVISLTKRDESIFEPDGIGFLKIGGRGLPFFLEWDRGGSSLGQISGKLRNYLDFMLYPEGWQGFFGSPRYPPVLIATPSQGRAELILAEAERLVRAMGQDFDKFIVLLTTHEELDQHGPLGPCWYRAGRVQKMELAWGKGISLLELMGVPA